MDGEPIQILKPGEKHKFQLDLEALSQILLQEDVKDKPVVVISIAGTYRTGKSFLLSFFLRYLKAKGNADWMGSENEPLLGGFTWAGGKKRVTTGIYMWSKPFVIDMEDGQQVVLVLMDTQGTFDGKSTMQESGIVFALSTMLSSVQIYNIKNIHEYDLQNLQVFTEYGKYAMEDYEGAPFQKLQFLIRDFDYDEDLGAEGGKTFLEEMLKVEDDQHEELKSVRRLITSCFSDISCFMMPYPGKKVSGNHNFDGKLSDIDEDFLEQLAAFVPVILGPGNLVIKKISGNNLTAGVLYQYFELYFSTFLSGDVPPPQTAVMGMIMADITVAYGASTNYYFEHMTKLMDLFSNNPNAKFESLQDEHNQKKTEALVLFSSKRKRGDNEYSERSLKLLEKEIEDKFNVFKKRFECRKKLQDILQKEKQRYLESMKLVFQTDDSNDSENWEEQHRKFVGEACKELDSLDGFDNARDLIEDYKKRLKEEILKLFENMKIQAVEKQQLQDVVRQLIEEYSKKMEEDCRRKCYIQEEILNSYHLMAKDHALSTFDSKSIINDSSLTREIRNQLQDDIQKIYNEYHIQNEKRKLYEKEVENVIKGYKPFTEDKWTKMKDAGIKKFAEHISSHNETHIESAMTTFNKKAPLGDQDMYEEYKAKLRTDMRKAFKDYLDTLICENAIQDAKRLYEERLEEMCNCDTEQMHPEELYIEHLKLKNETMDFYTSETKSVGNEVSSEYRRVLERELTDIFDHYNAIYEGVLMATKADWMNPLVVKWRKDATEFQEMYYNLLQNRVEVRYSSHETLLLERHISYAMFGPPAGNKTSCSSEQREQTEKIFKQKHTEVVMFRPLTDDPNSKKKTRYSREQVEQIQKLCKQIKENNKSNNLNLEFIFVLAQLKDVSCNEFQTHCVIYVEKSEGNVYEYFDCDGCEYQNWSDYLQKNKLSKCYICFPKNGRYKAVNGHVIVGFGTSPTSNTWGWFHHIFPMIGVFGKGLLPTSPFLGELVKPITTIVGAACVGVSSVYNLIKDFITPVENTNEDMKEPNRGGKWLELHSSDLQQKLEHLVAVLHSKE